MSKIMKFISVISFILTIAFVLIYQVLSNDIVFSLMITFGTIMHHFVIRLLAGELTCQAELVHEVNVILSFVPILASIWVGAFEIFLVTSILSAGFDLLFVFMQRFNRPRILKMMMK